MIARGNSTPDAPHRHYLEDIASARHRRRSSDWNSALQAAAGLPPFSTPPIRLLFANDEEIWSVEDTHPLSGRTLIIEFDCGRLVEIFEDTSVVFHLVNASQFDPMTLELDGHTHLPARIAAGHVRLPPSDTARRAR
jgi:hypothetical protein